MLTGKTIGLLAVLAIGGVTGAVGVIVDAMRPPSRPAEPLPPERPASRPHLTSATDVRTTALHRAHLEGADRLDCARCHDLAADEFQTPPVSTCVSCHAEHEPALHRGVPEAECLTCHDFLRVADARAEAGRCLRCHDRAQGARPAIAGTHTEPACTRCHPPHRARAEVDCLACHDQQATGHPVATGAKRCETCHQPHRPAREAVARCASCHVAGARDLPARVRIPQTALDRNHTRCASCHTGHTFTAATVAACTSCHAGKHVLGAKRSADGRDTVHAACTSCHDPHAPRAAPTARCATCHGAIAASSQHPRSDDGRDCVGCHPPHERLASRALGCLDRCHADKRTVGHGTARCTDCHARHRFVVEKSAPALCLECHVKPIGRVAAIATSDGHARCTSCHRDAAHRPDAPRPTCASCHQVQASTAPAGHAECTRCHDVHSGGRLPRATRCENCHADRTATPHVKVPGGCRACHRPHGPSAPATRPPCTQCHAQAALPGLHTSPAHRDCAGCHTAHAPAINSRDACLRCHTKLRDHQPDARLCQACHPFGANR